MICATSSTIYPAIRQWEEAGVALYNALENYIELSTSLGRNTLADGAPPTYLATRIDSALGCLHTTVARQLSRVQSILSQERNQMLSPSHRFPEEVLSEIFMHVVFVPLGLSHRKDPTSMRRCVIDSYRALHNLLGVCTMWRKVALGRGALWSVVPLFQQSTGSLGYESTVELLLHRAKGVGLNLAADLPYDPEHISVMARHASRFENVNIITSSIDIIRRILELFTNRHGLEPLAVSRLSIYQRRDHSSWLPEGEYIFQWVSEQGQFNELVKLLSAIQMRSVFLDWEAVTFSDRLTTFHFQDVMLGYDTEIIHLLNALSSATQLRDLRIIKINTCKCSLPLQDLLARSKTLLPNLQSLLIQDLYFNTLRLLLLSIQSRSHRLSLVFTRKSLRTNYPGGIESSDIDTKILSETLRSTPIHALLVDTETLDADEFVLSPFELNAVIRAVPSLETLWINIWELHDYYCSELQRPSEPHGATFPRLINLYFSCVDFSDLEAFKRMLNSYAGSIQLVALGGPSGLITRDDVHWAVPERVEEVAVWLEHNVPEFRRIDKNFEPPEFRHMLWQLW